MPHISGKSPAIEQDSKWNKIQTITNFLKRNQPKQYNILLEPCFTITGPFIQRYYDRLMKYSESNQSQQDTKEKTRMLLDYASTYPNAIICYKDSNMVLHVDSDVEYLIMPEARSCYAGHFYLIDWPSPSPIKHNPEINGPIHTDCKTIRNFVSSTAEAETSGTFNNRK